MGCFKLIHHSGTSTPFFLDYLYDSALEKEPEFLFMHREKNTSVEKIYKDYYTFGMLMPGRNYNSTEYKFGFNGMEKDDEVNGVSGANYTAEFWEYDARIGRRWNTDPISYAWQSPYACFNNNPIYFSDPSGLEAGIPPSGVDPNTDENNNANNTPAQGTPGEKADNGGTYQKGGGVRGGTSRILGEVTVPSDGGNNTKSNPEKPGWSIDEWFDGPDRGGIIFTAEVGQGHGNVHVPYWSKAKIIDISDLFKVIMMTKSAATAQGAARSFLYSSPWPKYGTISTVDQIVNSLEAIKYGIKGGELIYKALDADEKAGKNLFKIIVGKNIEDAFKKSVMRIYGLDSVDVNIMEIHETSPGSTSGEVKTIRVPRKDKDKVPKTKVVKNWYNNL